jgi:hypothetical protein
MKVWAIKKGNKYAVSIGYGELYNAAFFKTKKEALKNIIEMGGDKKEIIVPVEIKEIE